MRHTALSLPILALLLASASTAAAQPATVAAYPPPAPSPQQPGFGIGLHVRGMSLVDTEIDEPEPEDFKGLGGSGLHLRYRLNKRFGVELGMDALANVAESRKHSSVQLSAVLHLTPRGNWNWYVLAGFGGGTDEITHSGHDYKFEQGSGHLGMGLERRFGRIGLGAEIRSIAVVRDEHRPELGLPEGSSGATVDLGATFYF